MGFLLWLVIIVASLTVFNAIFAGPPKDNTEDK